MEQYSSSWSILRFAGAEAMVEMTRRPACLT
jgi:hypothetical protein